MSERYTRLFSLPEDLYAEGSPVIIAAGALLKDNQTGRVLAQLKFRSISEKRIQAVKVCLNLLDTAGQPIGETVLFDYLDLVTSRDTEFGQKTPVMLPENKARAYTVRVTEVVFSDMTVWTAGEDAWKPLPRQQTLEAVFQDPELVEQYKIAAGYNSSFYPTEKKGLWFCACGGVNRAGQSCHVCGRTLAELQAIDQEQLVRDKDARLAEEARLAAERQAAEKAQRAQTAKRLKVWVPVVCVVIILGVLVKNVVIPTVKYNSAVSLMENGQYEEAIAAFEAMDGYKDSVQKIEDCETAILEEKYNAAVALMDAGRYEEAIAAFEAMDGYKDSQNAIMQVQYNAASALADSGKTAEAAIAFGKLGDYQDARQRSFALWDDVAVRETVSAGTFHTVGLKTNGKVVAVGYNEYGQCDVSSWSDIVAVSAGYYHTVGLKADGTVVAVGSNKNGQCEVSGWTDIVSVSAGSYHTVGLKADGTVVAAGYNEYGQRDVRNWSDIIAISAGSAHTVGLKSNGTVIAVGHDEYDQCNVNSWSDIVAVSAGNGHTVGLKSDGTVLAVGNTEQGRCNVRSWTDIASVNAEVSTIGLKTDGTIVFAGEAYNKGESNQYDAGNWTNIISISSKNGHTVGLKRDGTVVAAGLNKDGQCDVSNWTDIKLPN